MNKVIAITIGLFLSYTGFNQSCLPDGIIFESQEQIDNFQTDFPDCSQIEGWVFIGHYNSDITNLNGLSCLTFIGEGFYISENNFLVDLTGLENLTSIGGPLSIGGGGFGGNDSLISLAGLEGITSIGGDLVIHDNQNLVSLTALENLDENSIEGLIITSNSSLSDCEIQSICNYLSSINGPIDIYNNGPGCQNPSEIASACGITLPCLPYGNYHFQSQADIDDFPVNFPGCTELQGEVWILYDDITNLYGFNDVISISGYLVLWHNLYLSSLSGLDQLNYVGQWLLIQNDDSLTNLAGLGNLTSVGRFTIAYNDGLLDLTGLDNLESIGEGLELSANNSLSSLTGLENLNYFDGYLQLNDNNAMTSLTGLNNLTSIGGNLSIFNNDALNDLTGLESLNSIGSIGIGIIENDTLNSLSGLDSLTSVSGALYIRDNKVLTNISAIDNIDPDLITELIIDNNDCLSVCDVKSICNYLASPNGYVLIENNATGCNSRVEILSACEVGLNENDNEESFINIYPNPASAIFTIEMTELFNQSELTILNLNGQALEHYQIMEPRTLIDISHWPDGVYFVRLTSDSLLKMFKIVKY